MRPGCAREPWRNFSMSLTATARRRFYPEQVFKDTAATFGYVMILVLFANFGQLGLGSMADPTDTRYIPRPEWYFMFLFELLKVFEGPMEVVGAVILPNLAMVALILVPFFDRARVKEIRRRTVAIAIVVFAALGWAGLTQRAIATTPPSMEDPDAGLRPPQPWLRLPPEHVAAIGFFQKDNCGRCHVLGRSVAGPDLTVAPSEKTLDWLLAHFARPEANAADLAKEEGPVTSTLTGAQQRNLASLVMKRNEDAVNTWTNPPAKEVAGAMLYQARGCGFCHTLNSSGAKNGPILNGLAARRTRDWVEGHFAEPAKFSPNSQMPAYKFNPEELDTITTYLMGIPK